MLDDDSVPKTAVIVEDDPDVRHLLAEVLEAAGFSTVSVGNGIDGVRAVLNYQPLITTLDVNMPGIDGFEAARRIRAQSDTYIIMLTALDEEADVVLGLSAGADEYLNKPFRPRELRARIDALLRRPRGGATAAPSRQQEQSGPSFPAPRQQPVADSGWTAPASAPQFSSTSPTPMPGPMPDDATTPPTWSSEVVPVVRVAPEASQLVAATEGTWMRHRDLQLNPDTRIVNVQGNTIELTRTEFDLLCTLMESKRRVRSKADLTLVLRGESYVTSYFVGDADKRAIEAHMTNLRRKLGDNPVQPRYIETVRGVGYRLTAEAA